MYQKPIKGFIVLPEQMLCFFSSGVKFSQLEFLTCYIRKYWCTNTFNIWSTWHPKISECSTNVSEIFQTCEVLGCIHPCLQREVVVMGQVSCYFWGIRAVRVCTELPGILPVEWLAETSAKLLVTSFSHLVVFCPSATSCPPPRLYVLCNWNDLLCYLPLQSLSQWDPDPQLGFPGGTI